MLSIVLNLALLVGVCAAGDISTLPSGSDKLPTNPTGYAYFMIFSQDGTRLFVGSTGKVDVFAYNQTNNNISTLTTLPTNTSVYTFSMIFSQDGTRLFVGSYGKVDVFAYSTGTNYKYVYFYIK